MITAAIPAARELYNCGRAETSSPPGSIMYGTKDKSGRIICKAVRKTQKLQTVLNPREYKGLTRSFVLTIFGILFSG